MNKSNSLNTSVAIAFTWLCVSQMLTSMGYTKIYGNLYGPLFVDGGFDCTGQTITCTITVDGRTATAYNSAANANAQGAIGILKRN